MYLLKYNFQPPRAHGFSIFLFRYLRIASCYALPPLRFASVGAERVSLARSTLPAIQKPWPLASSQGLIPYPVRYPSASDIHGMKEVFVQPHASRFILEIRIIIPCRLFTHTTVLHDHVVSWMLRFIQEHISYTRQVS